MLNHGLKFAPDKTPSKFGAFIDMQKYIRKISIKRYFRSQPPRLMEKITGGVRHSGLSNAFLFNPPGHVPPSVLVFKDLVLKDLDKLKIKE